VKKPKHLNLILAGVFAGLIPNLLVTIPELRLQPLIGIIVGTILIFTLLSLAFLLWNNEKIIRKNSHKWRWVFFGISLVSFIFAFIDLGTFFIARFFGHIIETVSRVDITLGGVSVFSMFTSFAVAGFFSLLERYFDLHEKKDI
jgi:hypothetical protein